MTPVPPTTSLLPILFRVFWMMIGPVVLVILTFNIVQAGNGWFTPTDFGFLGVLGCVILARYLEFRGGNPQTASGEPATAADLRRYVATAALLGMAVYVIANLIANYWLVR